MDSADNRALEVRLMNRVVWVEAEFKEWDREEKSLLGKVKKKRIVSNCRMDGERLARDVQSTVDLLHEEGYEVIAVTPVTSGNFSAWDKGGFGYSFTEGVLVTARLANGMEARMETQEERLRAGAYGQPHAQERPSSLTQDGAPP
jgi:hypothetical protein